MYIPPQFEQTDRATLFNFIEAHSFGLLVSRLHDEPFATHLPLLAVLGALAAMAAAGLRSSRG